MTETELTYNEQFTNVFNELREQMIEEKLEMAETIKKLIQSFELKYGIGVTEITPIKSDAGNVLATEHIVIKMMVW